MGFSLNSGRTIAEPVLMTISGERGLGVLEFRFSVEWAFNSSLRSWGRIHSTQGVAYGQIVKIDSTPRLPLGQVWPETSWTEETQEQERKTSLMYRLFVRPEQLLAIERAREGHSLELSLDLCGLIDGKLDGETHAFRGNSTIRKTMNPHDWAELLRSLGVRDTLFVGVDLPLDSASYSNLLRQAHDHLINGRYEATVGECRKAIDALLQGEGLDAEAKILNGIVIGERHSQRERRLGITNAIKRFTQRALHPEGGEMASFSREDAALAVAATISALASIITDQESRRAVSS